MRRFSRYSWLPLALILAGLCAAGASMPASAQAGAGVEILSLATEKCLDVADASLASGADVNQVRCHGRANQRWRAYLSNAPGYVYFRNDQSGLCLDVRIGGPEDGTLQQYTCHYRDNQLFRLEMFNDAEGGARIVARHSGRCLDVPGGQAVDGLGIQQFQCHAGANQRWLYAPPGTYRYPLVVSPIGALDFLLREGRSYTFELRGLPIGGAPVLHLWSNAWGNVAYNTGPAGPQVSMLSHTVPAGRGGVYRLFSHARQWTASGTATLTVYEDGNLIQTRNNVPFGGTVVDVFPSSPAQLYRYDTALSPGGPEDLYLLALGGDGRLLGHDDDGGVGRAASLSGPAGAVQVVVGSRAGTGAAAFFVNDVFHDRDGDGLGYGLERELGTCDLRLAQAHCGAVHNLQDTDRDGLTDAAEVLGIEATPPMHLPRWGASPVHKDVFVEVDYTVPRYPRMPLTEADAEAIRDYFLAGSAADLKNPDGRDGVAIHLDLGFEPQKAANRTLMGNWGGSNGIREDHPDKPSFRRPERRNVFFHAILHTGGQGIGSDVFGSGLLGGPPRNRVRTFVHELGHVLNLEHEGGNGERPLGLNCSAVYPSIMNYAGEDTSGPWGDPDFALGTEYPGVTLNPARLCEAEGLGGADNSYLAGFGLATQGQGVDWNRDGTIESCSRPVRARVNWYPPKGCATHVQGRFGEDRATLANGSSPSLARLGDYLYLFYVDPDGQLRYTRGLQGTRWPQSGCPYGLRGGPQAEGKCTDWAPATATPEEAPVNSVRAIGVGGRMYVTYTRPGSDAIWVLIAEGARSDGQLIYWSRKSRIPDSRSAEAPALGIVYEQGFGGRISRLLVAMWPNSLTYQLEGAHVDLANSPGAFLPRAVPQDAAGNPIQTNGAPATLAFWGRDDGRGVATNQTWMVLAGEDSLIRVYRYDPVTTRWRDLTVSVFPERPTGEVRQRMGFAFRPLLDAMGRPLHALRGEFTLVYGAANEGGVSSIWISDVVDEARPPDRHLRFPRILAGRLGHPWYAVALENQAGFDLYNDPGFPFLKGALVRADRRIAFLAYADGIFDLDFQSGSDYQVMERGICLRLHDGDTGFCGPPNQYGY